MLNPAYNRTIPRAAAGKARLSLMGRLFICVMLVVIFEGAIRKWLVPSATLPLILLRDALAIYAIARALMHGRLRRDSVWFKGLLIWSTCVLGWGLLQLTLGESTFPVLFIGLRFWLLYIWFGVALASEMTEHDYIVSVRVLLATLLVMTPLVLLQHFSPPGAPINMTPDTDEENIFILVEGVVRTTGTFTFTAGFVMFLAICAPLVLGANEARKKRIFQLVMALVLFACLVASCLVSGARMTVLFTGALLGVYLLGNLIVAPVRKKGFALLMAVTVVLSMAAMLFFFQDAVLATQQRFETASESEDFLARIYFNFLGEPWVMDRMTWVGAGIGQGSNLAQYVQTGARQMFYLAESEPGRTLLEGGVLGAVLIGLKYLIVLGWLGYSMVLSMRTRAIFPVLMWASIAVALISWPVIAQLTANAMFGVLLAFGLLSFKYPQFRLFG